MMRSVPSSVGFVLVLAISGPSAAWGQHAGHHPAPEVTRLRATQRHAAGVTTALQNVDAALQRLASSVDALEVSGAGRTGVPDTLVALTGDIRRARGTLAALSTDPSTSADADVLEHLHASAKNLEQITKAMENLTRNVQKAVDRQGVQKGS